MYAGESERAPRVKADDLRMRAIGPQESRVQLALEIPVRGVTAGAGDETDIFLAGCRHEKISSPSAGAW